MENETKKCPYCAEDIKKEAIFCKHCKSSLDESKNQSLSTNFTNKLSNINLNDLNKLQITEILLFAIPILGILLNIFWISNMGYFDDKSGTMNFVNWSVYIGLIITVFYEASILEMKNDPEKAGGYTKIGWSIMIFLFWPIGYPYYMFVRKYYSLRISKDDYIHAKNRIIPALIIVIIYFVSVSIAF